MVKRWSLILPMLLIVFGTCTRAAAQEPVPVADLFVGYSLFPANGDDFPRATSQGLQTGVSLNVTRTFGIVAEYAQQWNSTSDLGPNFAGLTATTTVAELLVGPRFTARGTRADVFAHGWLGRAIGRADEPFAGFSDSGLALGGGGGVDVRLTPALSWRMQFDYVGSFADMVDNNTRFATGLVARFGQRR
jgi:hypothetical protein